MARSPIAELAAVDQDSGTVNVVIETPKFCRNKFKFDERHGLFTLSKVLPAGAVFPFDFGYVPATLGGDGDPLDVLVLMDEPVFTGCLVPSRLIGVIEAQQTTKKGKKSRNDRLIAVCTESVDHEDIRALRDVNKSLLREIEHFFTSYHKLSGSEYKVLRCRGPKPAQSLLEAGIKTYAKAHRREK